MFQKLRDGSKNKEFATKADPLGGMEKLVPLI